MNEWKDDELKVLSDTVEYHGKVPNMVIDDLAERFGRSPEAVRARIRQIKLASRKAHIDTSSVKAVSDNMPNPNLKPKVRSKARITEAPHYTGLVRGLEDIQASLEAITVKETQIRRLQEEVASLKTLVDDKRSELLEIYPEANRLLERY